MFNRCEQRDAHQPVPPHCEVSVFEPASTDSSRFLESKIFQIIGIIRWSWFSNISVTSGAYTSLRGGNVGGTEQRQRQAVGKTND